MFKTKTNVVKNIDRPNLWKDAEHHKDVIAAYSENEVDEACYYARDSILKYRFEDEDGNFKGILDIGNKSNRKGLIYGILKRIFRTEPWFREVLERDYNYEFIDRFIEDMDFESAVTENRIKHKDAKRYIDRYEEEFSILVRAFEQAIALIYFNPLLRDMLKTAQEKLTANTIDIRSKKLISFMDRIQDRGLPIMKEEHEDGFGSVENHGSISLDNNNEMELHLDIRGQLSVQELCHEYAAYEFIRKSLDDETPHFPNEDRLYVTKQKKLRYILLFIDLIAGRSKAMQDALTI